MTKQYLILCFLIYLTLVICQSVPGYASDCPALEITMENQMISIDVTDVPIDCVLEQISEQTGIPIKLWQNNHQRISLSLRNVLLDDLFKKLGMGNALVYTWLPETEEYRLIAIDLTDRNPGRSAPPENQNKQETRVDASGKPGELLVKFNDHIPEDQIKEVHRFLGSTVLKQHRRLNLFRIKLNPQLSRETAIRMYLATGLVETAEPHYTRTRHQITPNDPGFIHQWGLSAIQATEAWHITQGSQELIIAIIDTGIDSTHPDLARNIWVNEAEAQGTEGVDDDNNGYIDDIHGWDFPRHSSALYDVSGHGTHIAGIIGAHTHNALDIAGVCPNIKIMALNVESDDGEMAVFDIISAIDYATHHGAKIINCSFGGIDHQALEQSALETFAAANDGLIVCSAGNSAKNIDIEPLYPASYDLPQIISVAASSENRDLPGTYQLADFSNFGAASVDVMAPGDTIYSTAPDEKLSNMSGTSMAAGFVSGAVGLLRAHAPGKSALDIKTILLDTAVPVSGSVQLANGQINVLNALYTLPFPGDMDKNFQLRVPDTVSILQILSGQPAEAISEEIRHWDANDSGTAGLPESITVLQNTLDAPD